MYKVAVISSSVRIGRNSHRVALFLEKFISRNYHAIVDLIDLDEFQFPVFDERLRLQHDPDNKMVEFAERITNADGVIIVTPEYNGGYPASLKNAIDFLYKEWQRKPVAIATVSKGIFGGSQVITSLQFVLWKIGAITVPAMFPTPKILTAYDEDGVPSDPEGSEKRAKAFIDTLVWHMEAVKRMAEEPALSEQA